jgi:hypothetical protein
MRTSPSAILPAQRMEFLSGDKSMITGSQCRAARALVEISRVMLARRSGVDFDTH